MLPPDTQLISVDDHVIELTISLAAAYGTYLLTDGLHQSGIIATVVAGVVIGTYGRAVGLSRRALEALDQHEQARRLNPGSADAVFNLGAAEARLGRTAQAAADRPGGTMDNTALGARDPAFLVFSR